MKSSFIKCIIIFFILSLVVANNAYAYIDPGIGSSLFQLAIVSILGIFYVIKIYFRRIILFLKNLFYKVKNAGRK